MRLLLLCVVISSFLSIDVYAQQDLATISGIIIEQESGETLIGANINVLDQDFGTVSNEYGFYSISLPRGEPYKIEFSYVG